MEKYKVNGEDIGNLEKLNAKKVSTGKNLKNLEKTIKIYLASVIFKLIKVKKGTGNGKYMR